MNDFSSGCQSGFKTIVVFHILTTPFMGYLSILSTVSEDMKAWMEMFLESNTYLFSGKW